MDLRRNLTDAAGLDAGTVVLVEGDSDRCAIEAVARRHGQLLDGVAVVPRADLEDELIRALGTGTVEQLVEAAGDLRSFRLFQRQPAQQGRPLARQLRRFIGTRSGRKSHYATLLAGALAPARTRPPLELLLARL
ncbi:hypothetical protein [Micromonospora sp. NPDC006431]|uniref:hypothetical protein n=1 Tax=unclassified Micromonospora TaxID=2617518 RepID=UPI0036791B19